MSSDRLDRLLGFLERLKQAKIPYELRSNREEAISVITKAPGEYWEIDFLADGDVDIERYRSNGHIDDESVLAELFALCSDEEASASDPVTRNANARK